MASRPHKEVLNELSKILNINLRSTSSEPQELLAYPVPTFLNAPPSGPPFGPTQPEDTASFQRTGAEVDRIAINADAVGPVVKLNLQPASAYAPSPSSIASPPSPEPCALQYHSVDDAWCMHCSSTIHVHTAVHCRTTWPTVKVAYQLSICVS